MTTRALTTYADIAAYYRAALLLGLESPESIIRWADGVIEDDPAPPPAIFDLSLSAAELTAVRAALQPMATEPEPWPVVQAILAAIARDLFAGTRTVDDTVHVLRQLRRLVALPRQIEHAVDALEDDHMLARAGIQHDLDAVRERIRAWLAPYAATA